MCLVEIEKIPRLQTACTTVVGEGTVERLRKRWTGGNEDGPRNAAVREAVAACASLPAIEQRQALDAIAEVTP